MPPGKTIKSFAPVIRVQLKLLDLTCASACCRALRALMQSFPSPFPSASCVGDDSQANPRNWNATKVVHPKRPLCLFLPLPSDGRDGSVSCLILLASSFCLFLASSLRGKKKKRTEKEAKFSPIDRSRLILLTPRKICRLTSCATPGACRNRSRSPSSRRARCLGGGRSWRSDAP